MGPQRTRAAESTRTRGCLWQSPVRWVPLVQCMSTGRSAVACNTCTSASDCFPQFHAPRAVSRACLHMMHGPRWGHRLGHICTRACIGSCRPRRWAGGGVRHMGCVAGQRALTRRDSSVLCIGSRFPTIGRCVQFTLCLCVCVCVCVCVCGQISMCL